MSELVCPYCEEVCEPDHELNQPDRIYDNECEHCGKTFVYTLDYIVCYSEHKAPCLNDGEHEWKDEVGCPPEYFAGKQRCKVCDKKREVAQSPIKDSSNG